MTDGQASVSGRIAHLETIRGLAALQVLLLHCCDAFVPTLIFASPSDGTLGSSIHLSPLSFLYDGRAAVYVFFALSGFVLSHSFARKLDRPMTVGVARALRLGIPALAAVAISALTLAIFGRLNVQAGSLTQSEWFVRQWSPDLSVASVLRDGIVNALLLGYSGISNTYTALAAYQQPGEQSFIVPLWTLSVEFYGSLLVLGLCLLARRSTMLWRAAVVICAIYFLRSAYLCFVVGHVAATLPRDSRGFGKKFAVGALCLGVLTCVMADFWQPEWLKALCAAPTSFLFPGQIPELQLKAVGAMLFLGGLVSLPGVRRSLSQPALVTFSQLSFPLYLVHWPIVFGPAAAIYVFAHALVGPSIAAAVAIAAAIALSLAASVLFLPVDRFALALSRRICRTSFDRTTRLTPSAAAAVKAIAP